VSREAWKPIVEPIDLVTSDPRAIDQGVRAIAGTGDRAGSGADGVAR
jgi:hypothetical protein